MKRSVLAALLVLLFVSIAIAETPKYQIYTEGKGFLGMSGKKTLMLDKETGNSWVYEDGKWVSIPRVEDELTAKARAEEERTKAEEEIAALKAKQDEEAKALKDKQDAELKAAMEKKQLTAKSAPKPIVIVPSRNWRKTTFKPKVIAKAKAEQPADESSGDEAPPAWLSE